MIPNFWGICITVMKIYMKMSLAMRNNKILSYYSFFLRSNYLFYSIASLSRSDFLELKKFALGHNISSIVLNSNKFFNIFFNKFFNFFNSYIFVLDLDLNQLILALQQFSFPICICINNFFVNIFDSNILLSSINKKIIFFMYFYYILIIINLNIILCINSFLNKYDI